LLDLEYRVSIISSLSPTPGRLAVAGQQ